MASRRPPKRDKRASGAGKPSSAKAPAEISQLWELKAGSIRLRARRALGVGRPAEDVPPSHADSGTRVPGDVEPEPVLVVDDDVDIREALSMLLEDAGWTVLTANDGQEAQRMLEAGLRPALILLDLMMPHMTGDELVDWLRSDGPELAELPVVILTASGALPSLPHDVPVLRKPAKLDALLSAVDAHARR